jgi:hypothetical protein
VLLFSSKACNPDLRNTMSAAEKGFYFRRVKAAGVPLTRHFREYTTAELKEADTMAIESGLLQPPTEEELAELSARVHKKKPRPEPRPAEIPEPAPGSFFGFEVPEDEPTPAPLPVARPELGEMAGERQNSKAPEDIISVDEQGRAWLQKEVLKPAFPKPRGRRVLRYSDPGVVKQTAKDGQYVETFEVAGDPRNATPAEIKITLPSYQVGMYRDPRYPFKVICYNGREGFDRLEVEAYYGGAELVPPVCKRMYVENVLCYDMRSVIRAVSEEYRALKLSGQI